jgi:catechol-2,3-dioxygenase
MEIRELNIFSNKMNEQEAFYENVLGFQCFKSNDTRFEMKLRSII